MASDAKPRFYALIFGQCIGLLIVLLGMIFHWCGIGNAKVPSAVTGRVLAICALLIISIVIPLINFFSKLIAQLANRKVDGTETFADNVRAVQGLIWVYVYADLFLLTYLVHTTGGVSGSMFTGVFLMLPYIPLILRLNQKDVLRARWLAVLCSGGILLSFLMSHFHFYEYKANQYELAFDLSITTVTMLALILPLVELSILRNEVEET